MFLVVVCRFNVGLTFATLNPTLNQRGVLSGVDCVFKVFIYGFYFVL